MARKRKQLPTIAELLQKRDETAPETMVGPYGTMRRVVCRVCHHAFYFKDDEYLLMSPIVCDVCTRITGNVRTRPTEPRMTREEFENRLKELLCLLAFETIRIHNERAGGNCLCEHCREIKEREHTT